MKFVKKWNVLFLPLTLSMLVACGQDTDQDTKDVSAEKAQRETAEAYDAVKAYAMKKKEEFGRQAEATLESYEKQIQELKARAEKAGGNARDKYREALAEWEKEKAEANKQLEELKSASADAWTEVEQRIETSMDELKRLYEEAKSALT